MFRLDSHKERFIALLAGCGLCIPIWRGWVEQTPPWEWNGDRLAIMVILLLIGGTVVFED